MERYQCAVMHDQCGGKASLTNSVLSFHSFGQLITMTMSTDNLHLWKTKPKLSCSACSNVKPKIQWNNGKPFLFSIHVRLLISLSASMNISFFGLFGFLLSIDYCSLRKKIRFSTVGQHRDIKYFCFQYLCG